MSKRARQAGTWLAVCLSVAARQGVAQEAAPMAHAHEANGLALFLSVQGDVRDLPSGSEDRHKDAWGIADLVFSSARGPWRLMGEYNLSSEEHDLERFQVGWEPTPDTVLWAGRFHHPASAWNNEYHHGHYLETAITRPALELWEDEGGPLPQHLSGLLFESRRAMASGAGYQLSLGAGFGSVLRSEGLEPVEWLGHTSGQHQVSMSGRLAWLPQYLGPSSVGLLAASHRLPVRDPALQALLGTPQVDIDVLGAYANLERESWRLVAAAYNLHVAPHSAAGGPARDVRAGYLQLELPLSHGLTAYARHETASGFADCAYLARGLPGFDPHATLGGLRWDVARQQALTLEVSRVEVPNGKEQRLRIQWSGALR